jgi:predicted MFS family arabinose efflux permease
MFTRTIALYRNAYTGLSPQTWWLSLVMLINRSGTMVVPFLGLYLTDKSMGFSIGQSGIVMGLFGFGAVIGAYISGKLTDKIGFYPIQLFTLLLGGVLFIVLGQMKTFPLICLFTFLLSFVNEAFRPANSTAIAFYSKEENRTRSYALNRLAINIGWAVGSAIAGFVASYNYELLFWIDGITNIVAAILMWIVLRPNDQANAERNLKLKTANRQTAEVSVNRDQVYLWFILFTFIFAACFFQLFTTLPIYFRNELHFSEKFIGMLNALNGIIIAAVEMILVFKLEGKRSSTFYITRGVMLCALAYFMLSIFSGNWLLAVVMIITITFGEILAMPFMNTFWISRSNSFNRGQYAAYYTIAWASAQSLGPLIASQVVEASSFNLLWWIMGGFCMLSSIGFGWLHKKLYK